MSVEEENEPVIVAAVEGGGTSFVVAIAKVTGTGKKASSLSPPTPPEILHKAEFDSSGDSPSSTLQQCADFLASHRPEGGYHALGLATFGPLGVHPEQSSSYGCIMSTSPKAQWRNVNLLQPLAKACQGPARALAVGVETDVNAPALVEYERATSDANLENISSLAYITVGTGVGVGLVVNGKCVHGRMHPEGGHVPVQPLEGDKFRGYSWGTSTAPFHGKQTVEGIASSVALTERLAQMEGTKAHSNDAKSRNALAELPDDHEIWDHAANAISSLCVTLLLVTSMERIILGGGVMKRNGLLKKIQQRTIVLLNGYLPMPTLENMSTLIDKSQYGDEAGLVGALFLAQRTYFDQREGSSKASLIREESNSNSFWKGLAVGTTFTALAAAAFMSRMRR